MTKTALFFEMVYKHDAEHDIAKCHTFRDVFLYQYRVFSLKTCIKVIFATTQVYIYNLITNTHVHINYKVEF